ncbi:MAG TPA: hypothetical protein VN345_19155 [Blastocatellia bacterium]|jgi:hypothetical protein|nr:hypothetical protein [Blastocatellia bacterium]
MTLRARVPLLLLGLHLLVVSAKAAAAPAPGYLYDARLVQAAPGKLLELIDLYKARAPIYQASGDEPPFWMRHSQGDRWDLMLLFPMSSYAEYYRPDRIEKRKKAETGAVPLNECVAWQEDVFVYGPPLDEVKKAFTGAGFFHIEMFQSLAGKQAELYKQREMENAYLRILKEPDNLIFVRDRGAAWDLFTIGFYRDLKHYAESADVPQKQQEEAAKAAGFEDARHIGPYLRSLISLHHDTLAVAIK